MNVEWLAGWYATRLHALPDDAPQPSVLGVNKALCGAWVYRTPRTAAAQRRIDRGAAPRCKHCEQLMEKSGARLDLEAVASGNPLAMDQLAALRRAAERYETARRMNPIQWAAAWEVNMKTGKPFDEIIDNMRPFMFPKS